jgi:hypothetical protein
MGDPRALGIFGGKGISTVQEAIALKEIKKRKIGEDILIESCFKWGLLYDVSKQFYLFIDVIKPEMEQIGIVGGCAYNFNKRVDAMFSFSVQEMSNRFCIGFNLSKMKIKLMSSFHPQLGYSPSIMLLSNLNSKINSKQ